MILNWTAFTIFVVLAIASLVSFCANTYIHAKNPHAKNYRFEYLIASIMFILFSAAVADDIFK